MVSSHLTVNLLCLIFKTQAYNALSSLTLICVMSASGNLVHWYLKGLLHLRGEVLSTM
jgi:hypothetical protein